MRIIHGLYFFYKKLILPAVGLSIFLSLMTMPFAALSTGIGISFIFLLPCFQYLVYELRNPAEYFFYYNLGLSKGWLWLITIGISLLAGFILMLL